MMQRSKKAGLMLRSLLAILIVSISLPLQAAECPAGEGGKDINKPSFFGRLLSLNSGVTIEVLGEFPLDDQIPGTKNRNLRFRKFEIAPGGEVGWHPHANRPGIIYFVDGKFTEYRSDCRVPIDHQADSISLEAGDFMHRWRNRFERPVTLIAADIYQG